MSSPFDNSSALAPFFDSVCVIKGQTVKCCAFPPELADPLADLSEDSDALVTTILVRRIGAQAWNDPSNPPKTGDEISVGEQSYVALSVKLFDQNYFTIKAKSK